MTPLIAPFRFRALPALLVFLALAFSWLTLEAQEAKRSFDIPAGKAEVTLKKFADQAGIQFFFSADKVAGVNTHEVKGEMVASDALGVMLAQTELVAVPDTITGAYTIRRSLPLPEAEKNVSSRPAGSRAASSGITDDGALLLGKVEVIGHVDGLNNRGLLQAGVDAPLYQDVVSQQDIERLGISSLEELFRFIPQTSSATTSLQAASTNTNTTGGLVPRVSTVSLRGFSASQTVILINGRALPRSGLGSEDGPDISRIPLAAIDRVEILPYAGSAIYGAGAIGGAINIILRKEYIGRDLTTYFGTSTDGGATEYRTTYLEGRTFNHGKTNLTYTLSYQHRDALRANQRGYLDEALRRYGPNSKITDAQGTSIFEQYILDAFAGSPATILVGNNPTSEVNDLGIPGAAGVRYASVPVGTTAAQSFALTPASFTATAGKATLSPRFGRSILYEPVDAYNLNAQLEHEFVKDLLNGYGEFTLGYNRKDYDFPQRLAFDLSETDPLNPFRTDVTPGFVGRPVRIFVDTPDIRDPSVVEKNESARAVLGLKGKITETWEWSVDGAIDYTHGSLRSSNPPDNLTFLESLTPYADPGPSAPADTRRAVYALLADHSAYPLSAADSQKYFDAIRESNNHGAQWEGNARLMGEVIELPAGPLKASAVGKYQHWKYAGGQVLSGSDAYSQLVNNGPYPANVSNDSGGRHVWQGAAELSVPVIGRKWHPLPVESLEFQGSFSRESDTSTGIDSNGEPFTNKQGATSGVIAGKLQLTRDLAFRGSYSEGFYPPDWSAVSLPTSSFSIPGFFADPKRGNTMQFTPTMDIIQGGNPNLKPETARSQNVGFILTPRFLPNFSLNVDYWRIKKVDAIVFTSFTTIIANPEAYGFLITRQAPDASDTAQGWFGRITAVDARAFNAATTDTDGIDVHLNYLFKTESFGSLDFTGGSSFTNHFLLAATPTAPVINTAGGSGPIRWRANSSVTWSKDVWSATLTGRYVGHRSTESTTASPSYPGAYPLDGGRIPAFLHWDVQVSYEIPSRTGGPTNWRTWLADTKWTLGVLNVLNDKPTFVTDGTSFYNTYDDPRQRYVYVQIKKSF